MGFGNRANDDWFEFSGVDIDRKSRHFGFWTPFKLRDRLILLASMR